MISSERNLHSYETNVNKQVNHDWYRHRFVQYDICALKKNEKISINQVQHSYEEDIPYILESFPTVDKLDDVSNLLMDVAEQRWLNSMSR